MAAIVRGTVIGDSDGKARFGSPFGERTVHPALAAAIDYIDKGYDADLGGVRDYDPQLGRFLTPDPYFLEHGEKCIDSPVECNLYGYAKNDPLRFSDPTGRDAVAIGVGIVIVGAAATIVTYNVLRNIARREPVDIGWAVDDAKDRMHDMVSRAKAALGFTATAAVAKADQQLHNEGPKDEAKPAAVSPVINPAHVAGKTPEEIDEIAKSAGLIPKGKNPAGGLGSYVDPVTGKQRVLVHTQPKDGQDPHAHVNDADGNRLGVDGQRVPKDSKEAHLPLQWKP